MIKFLRRFSLLKKMIDSVSIFFNYLKYKKLLDENKEYSNKYTGKRCFIIGNGPSLKTQDITPLKNEFTFVVNSFIISDLYDKILPKFYAVGDSNFFRDENPILIEQMKSIAKKAHKPICIFPVKHKKRIEEMGLNKSLKIIYVMPDLEKKTITNTDLTKPIPMSRNVVNYALFSALGMGFSEIYLIGVDMTGVYNLYDNTGEITPPEHFYNKTKDFVNYNKEKGRTRSNELMLAEYSKVFRIFRLTNDYAQSKRVKIVNLTAKGALDVFPIQTLNSIINK